jgi:hypothetical protein
MVGISVSCDILQESAAVDEKMTPIADDLTGGDVFDLDCPSALLFLPLSCNDFILQLDKLFQVKLSCCAAKVLQDLRSSCIAVNKVNLVS